ncbi:hypothetical protein GQ54DRAFT_254642 [Martensiomyces pterosporus]|nr:hypothetical protein GQ54DRAFT_254642 [Martensiomyces pterosporus]
MLPRTRAIYENNRVLDQSGQLLFRAGKKRLQWYLDRGLAKRIDEETIQLTFQNKGDGRRNEPFYLQDMENRCVVCGCLEGLTLHHIVPHQYRQFMPESTKSHSSYDLLPLCMPCHDRYERHAVAYKKHIAGCFAAPLEGIGWVDRVDIGRAGRAAAAVMAADADKIPAARREELRATVQSMLIRASIANGSDVAEQASVMHELCAMKARIRGPDFCEHGEMVVSQLADKKPAGSMCKGCCQLAEDGIPGMVFSWRTHFIEHAKPEFLPEHWVADYPV